ncbi:TonB-dependent Receptor Plug Domain [Polaribacter sp. KT25b]|uniref:TonB-dependent receptor plug domain-containing protein n=1 Tax=Polaribacter sp. KT25b TaxID=1855336 RepID=UPI00087D667B|nr:TonB-dependent receptor [Polaribacter sp. KT25b]SDS16609.1 TonB-dependent Receptor Plug Domain [Polaribacter sp. KT25b]
MKKSLLLITLFFTVHFVYSQEEKISIEFNNLSQLKAIELLEQNTNYQFYFIDNWFVDKKTITKKFTNVNIQDILDVIFKNSDLNYFVFEKNKIILTKNSRIHSSIYKDNKVNETLNENIVERNGPILLDENNTQNDNTKTIVIGREKVDKNQKFYTLSGYVKKINTNEAIDGLILLERDKNIYTTTNNKGYFSIKLPFGINYIETVLSGIENSKYKIIMYDNGTYNFKLNETLEQLGEIIIQADVKNNIKSVSSGLVQIKIENIKTVPQVLGERDILKVATTLPGIKSSGEGSDGVNVRGGKTDQNLFLLDNSVLYNPTHFLGLFSAVNPFVTKNLNVYKGSIPAEYGGRISSVFEITTKNSTTKKFSGEASIGPVTSNIALDIPIVKDKSGLIVGARGTYSDWILNAIDNESLNNSSASFVDAFAKYSHQINEKNSVNGMVYYSKDKYSISSDTTNTYGNKILTIDWDHKFNDKNFGNLSLSNSDYSFDIDYDSNSNNNFNLKYNINETTLKLKMNYLHSKKHNFNYGFSSKLYNVSPGSISPKGNSITEPFSVQEDKALENALYFSDDFSITKKLSLDVGLRYSLFSALGESTQRVYDENSPKNEATVTEVKEYKNNEIYKSYNGLSLRLSSRYFFNDDLSVKASYSNTYQYIHRLSNNTTASPTDTWKLSDLNIKPQEAKQASLGVYKNLDGNKYELSLEGYYKTYNNILDYKVGSTFLLNEHIETEVLQGKGKSYGAELLLRKNEGNLNGWISYSYSRSYLKFDSEFAEETINNGNYFSANFDKPHDLSIIANYKFTKRYSFSANFLYQTGRPVTYPIGKYVYQGNEYPLYSDRNEFRIPDYFRLDIGINIEGNHKIKKFTHSFWNISIYNLLGRNNPNSVFFVTDEGKVKAYQSSIFSKPIPTITYNFKF